MSLATLHGMGLKVPEGFAIPVIGLPGVSVPTGLTEAGLPMGVQVVAPRFREDLALDAAEAIEARCAMYRSSESV